MHDNMAQRIDRVEALLVDRLYLGPGRLEQRLDAAKGRLPHGILRRARELAQARAMLANPASAAKLDLGRLAATCDLVEAHLRDIPDGKYRKRVWSGTALVAALRVMAVLALVAAFVVWRGLV